MNRKIGFRHVALTLYEDVGLLLIGCGGAYDGSISGL